MEQVELSGDMLLLSSSSKSTSVQLNDGLSVVGDLGRVSGCIVPLSWLRLSSLCEHLVST